MQKVLEAYFDLDFLDELSTPRQKKDGNFYSTSRAAWDLANLLLCPVRLSACFLSCSVLMETICISPYVLYITTVRKNVVKIGRIAVGS